MKKPIRGSVLSFALLSVLAGCDRRSPPTDTAPAQEPEKSTEPSPAMTPASRETAVPAKKLDVKVVTGSEDGFRVNSTLITGDKDAVLIDAQFTLDDAKKVAEAVTASGKNLTTVYVTHAHPDHYFGFPAIKESFPNARLVALPATVAEIEKTWEAKVKEWQPKYKNKITQAPLIPEPIATNSLDLEGQKLEIVGGQQGDERENSYVWIPGERTVITGDIVYDEVYPWTAETTPEQRKAWRVTLDKLVALNPERVVPGHQKPEKKLDTSSIQFTKDYLAQYDEALAASKNAKELEAKMKAKYPDAALPVIAKIGAEAEFKSGAKTKSTDAIQPTDDSQPKTRTQPGSNPLE